MTIAITEDHRTLAEVTTDFLARHDSKSAARELLEADTETMPAFWSALAELGWLGLHIAEEHGGSGFGLPELVVVVEQLGAGLAPGPFVSTVIASAAIAASAPADVAARLLPGLADGSVVAGIGIDGDLTVSGSSVSGTAHTVLGGALGQLLVVRAGADLAIVERSASGVEITNRTNLDPTRRSAQVTFTDAPAIVVAGGGQSLLDLTRLVLAAEATGIARATTTMAADYARVREQFGRVIATFQAVKHHCANMLVETEIATGAVWDAARAAIESVKHLEGKAQVQALVANGYAVPHWPTPWGRNASAVEQLVIEEEFNAAGVKRPSYQITGWVILTLTQYSNEDQVARWIKPALDQDLIWCQLFSEPDAGSDAAGVKTKATRVDGGWLVKGQKVWTTGAHLASFGLITVRTNPEASKHAGITTMVVDMHAPGVEIRPLRMVNGGAEFNEVFFNDVFVPDDDVVGPVDAGWTVARGTLGNESVSLGSGDGAMMVPTSMFLDPFDANPTRLAGGLGRIGRATARTQAVDTLNVRSAQRAVAGGEPGPEGAVTKLLISENAEEAAAILMELAGPEGVYLDGAGSFAGTMSLMHRAMAIAGGTSEIKRNQIGERILGLPRDPLIN